MSRIERTNDKHQRAAAKREAEEMARVADEYKLDPLGDFAREMESAPLCTDCEAYKSIPPSKLCAYCQEYRLTVRRYGI